MVTLLQLKHPLPVNSPFLQQLFHEIIDGAIMEAHLARNTFTPIIIPQRNVVEIDERQQQVDGFEFRAWP